MAKIKPFKCIHPNNDVVSKVAALPYDVYSRKEAKEAVQGRPLSFLNIDRPETQFEDDFDIYSREAYEKAKELLDKEIAEGIYVCDKEEHYYIYELTMNGRAQTGIVACSSIDDYLENVIKKHENTRADKEADRINHVDICDAQTGPIFLAYRSDSIINETVEKVKETKPLYDFTSDDGILHRVWKISDREKNDRIRERFEYINDIYIADGHHRAASAVKVGLKRRNENPDYTGTEEFNTFLSVLFPDDQLMIMDYNRVVSDLNGLTTEEFLEKIAENYEIECVGTTKVKPDKKGVMGMYIDEKWYRLVAKDNILSKHPVEGLDVSLLQNYVLAPILGIGDPRTDSRIDFVGGIRGLSELERRCHTDMTVAFSMYPTSIAELFAVSDASMLMPPKSTWFEPKLRSGIFIHKLS